MQLLVRQQRTRMFGAWSDWRAGGTLGQILIDANVYLRAYDSSEVAELLPSVLELRSQLFVSQQLVREVERNRLRIVAKWLKQVESQFQYSAGGVPKSLGTSKELKKVSKSVASAKNAANAAEKAFKELAARQIGLVAAGTDPVSRVLTKIFAQATAETPAQLERARARKEVGQLPGKPNDPLGDELTWEQYIEQLRRDDESLVVSSDGDLVAKPWPGSVVLQPPLSREVMAVTGKPPRAFVGLSELLKHVNPPDSRGHQAPSEKKLTAAAKVESVPRVIDFKETVEPFAIRYSTLQVPLYTGIVNSQIISPSLSLEATLICSRCGTMVPSGATSCPGCLALISVLGA